MWLGRPLTPLLVPAREALMRAALNPISAPKLADVFTMRWSLPA